MLTCKYYHGKTLPQIVGFHLISTKMWQVDSKVWKAPSPQHPSVMVGKFNTYLMNNTGICMPELEFFCMGNRPAIMVLRGFISISSVHPVPLNLLSMVSPFRSACRRLWEHRRPPVAYYDWDTRPYR